MTLAGSRAPKTLAVSAGDASSIRAMYQLAQAQQCEEARQPWQRPMLLEIRCLVCFTGADVALCKAHRSQLSQAAWASHVEVAAYAQACSTSYQGQYNMCVHIYIHRYSLCKYNSKQQIHICMYICICIFMFLLIHMHIDKSLLVPGLGQPCSPQRIEKQIHLKVL